MAKFNIPKAPPQPDVINRAGGEAFSESPELALVNLLLTSFMKDKYYESAEQETVRLSNLLDRVNPRFAAKAAIYARQEFGIRSITHFVAAHIGKTVKGERWTSPFLYSVIRRPDDITEILSCYSALNGGKIHPVPASFKKGLGRKLSELSAYELAKYKGEGKGIKLVDTVNLLRPRGSEALAALVRGTLKPPDTWEAKVSQSGREGTEEEKEAAKTQAWEELILKGKLGYFALIRNIRNILEAEISAEAFKTFLAQLSDGDRIRKSLVFPFRLLTAYKAVLQMPSQPMRKVGNLLVPPLKLVIEALSQALEQSLANIPVFGGKTLLALDCSGSMESAINKRGPQAGATPLEVTAREIGGMFAAALSRQGADLMLFHERAWYWNVDPTINLLAMTASIPQDPRSTNFQTIFRTANKPYDRVIILSDTQSWVEHEIPDDTFKDYKRRTGAHPKIYTFNLVAYGDMQFPEKDVYVVAGFSDKVFDIMKLLETDRQALIHAIEAIELPA